MTDEPQARVLVVDDEDDLRSTLERFLTIRGYQVRGARDGRAALAALATAPADLVVTDLYMPGMDGMEFLMALRTLTPRPRVLVMSGGGGVDHDMLETAEALGATGTISKPFDLSGLADAVKRALADG